MTALATVVAAPVGILIAIFDTEVGGRLAAGARFFIDVMAALPSIVIGIFVYSLSLWPRATSRFAGSMALAAIMLP